MIDPDDKPTAWEIVAEYAWRRASVWPTVICHVFRHAEGWKWRVEFGAPGICAQMVTDKAPTMEAACKAADAAALVMIDATIARMIEARVCAGGRSVYVAGGSNERLSVARGLIEDLIARGVDITYDWTREPGWDDPSLADPVRCARTDIDAVRACSVLWYVAPADKSEGSAAELGAALVLGKVVVVSGPHARALGRIFPELGTHIYETHAEALEAVATLVLGRAPLAITTQPALPAPEAP